MSAKKTQLFLILSAFVLFVLLFITPKVAPKHSQDDGHDHELESATAVNGNIELYLNMVAKNVSPNQKEVLDKFVAEKNYDSLTVFWNRLKRPDFAAYYAEKNAELQKNAESWALAGNRYYYSIQFVQDKSEIPILYQSAIRCFNKVLELEPKNVDSKIMLASSIVESSQDPMKGIGLLKEIEKTDSNNIKLQLTFAFLSIKSKQFDKAVVRFNKVLEIDSNYIEAYLHLADAYEQQGQTLETIKMLEKYSAKTTDITAQIEINKYIEQLKNNN